MLEQIVLTLVSGVAVPILLETWKNRRDQPKATSEAEPRPAAQAKPVDAPAPAARPSLLRASLRLGLAAVGGTIIALVVSVIIGPDTTEFTTQDGVLSFLFVLGLWYLLGKYGPLANRR